MAYTGILVRGETLAALFADPPVLREVAFGGIALGLGVDSDGAGALANYYFNVPLLSKIGEFDSNGAVAFAGFKTSDIAINFNGPGYIKEAADHMLVGGSNKFYYAISGLKEASYSNLKVTNGTDELDMDPAVLSFATTKPVNLSVSTSQATVTYTHTLASGFMIYNETTGVFLGSGDTTGATVVFAASQASGDVITAWLYDTNYNYSSKLKGVA